MGGKNQPAPNAPDLHPYHAINALGIFPESFDFDWDDEDADVEEPEELEEELQH